MDVMAIGRAIETLPLPPSLIVVSPDALHDLERKYHDLSFEILVTKYRGVQLVKDPGLHEGTIEIIADAEVARRRLHLISLGLTVTADGLIKSSR